MAGTPVIALPPGLKKLFAACERFCMTDCCGIDAYDFSPLWVAAYLASADGRVNHSQVTGLLGEINGLQAAASLLPSMEDGFVCTIEGTNQLFTKNDIDALLRRIGRSITNADNVVQYSKRLDRNTPAHGIENDT